MTLSGAVPTSFSHFADVNLRFHDVRRCKVVFLASATYVMHVNVSVTVKTVGGISLFDGGKLGESEGYFFRRFLCVRIENRSALVRDLLNNKTQFVVQAQEDKSLALRASDLIYFTTDLQTVIYYLTNHC